MIVRTLIEPDAIREAVANSPDGGKEALTRLATELRRHGAIDLIHEEDLKAALQPLQPSLKPAVAKLWEQLLIDLRRSGRIIDAGTRTQDSGTPGLRSPDRLAGIDLAIRNTGSVPEGGRGRAGGVHLSTVEEVDRSPIIKELRRLKYAENYEAGTKSERVWNERFAACARISKRVTLVDKYVFGGTSGLNRELVSWVLTRLEQERLEQDPMLGLELELIGVLPPETQPEQIRAMIADRDFGELQSNSIKIWVAPWAWSVKVFDRRERKMVTQRRSGPHNRHIRFSCGAAFTMEEGFDRLWYRDRNRGISKPKVWGSSGVTPHFVGSNDPALGRLARIEEDLKKATLPDRIFQL